MKIKGIMDCFYKGKQARFRKIYSLVFIYVCISVVGLDHESTKGVMRGEIEILCRVEDSHRYKRNLHSSKEDDEQEGDRVSVENDKERLQSIVKMPMKLITFKLIFYGFLFYFM